MLSEFALAGGVGLHLLGGEPLLRKDLATTIYVAIELGLQVSVTTNGWFTPDDETAAWLLSKLVTLSVSIDGHDATINDAIRGASTFEHAVASIQRYREIRNKTGGRTQLNISHVLCESNAEHMSQMIRLANELAVDSLSITYLKEYGNALLANAPKPPLPEQLLAAMESAATMAPQSRTALVLFEVPRRLQVRLTWQYGEAVKFGGDDYCDTAEGQLRVSSDGLVYPCFAGSKHYQKFPQGNAGLDIRRSPLPVILGGAFFGEFVEDAHRRLRETGWTICSNCEYFHDRTCYPGCPYEKQNLKPQLCSLLQDSWQR